MKAQSHEFELFGCKFETGLWGVFETESQGVHVAPCDEHGDLEAGHRLDWDCECKPEWDQGVCSHRQLHVEH